MNELYSSLSPALREEVSRYEERVAVPAGTKLISQNATPEHLLIVQQGSVEISVPTEARAISLGEAGKGKVLGLREVLIGAAPEIEAAACEDCIIGRISRSSFLKIVQEHPEVYFAISRVLSNDLQTAQRFLRAAPRNARERNRAEARAL